MRFAVTRAHGRCFLGVAACLMAGGVAQWLTAGTLALRSRVGTSGFDTGLVVSLYRQPAGLVSWAPPRDPTERRAQAAAFAMWPHLADHRPPPVYQQLSVQYWSGVGVEITSGFGDNGSISKAGSETQVRTWMQRYSAGWPMRSTWASVDRSGVVRGGVLVPSSWMPADRAGMYLHWGQPQIQPIVPLRPYVLGTAINTAIFSVPFLLVLPIAWLRRVRRRRAGRCPHCGYDRSGLADAAALCPECGRSTL